MTSIILDAATSVVLDKTGLSNLNPSTTGTLNGRSVTHWSFYVFIAGSVVGTIAAVAGFVLWYLIPAFALGLAIGVGGLVLGLTNTFAAVYVKKFGQLRTMEEYTKQLELQVKEFSGKVDQIHDVNKDLEKVTEDLGKVPKDWKAEIESGEKKLKEKIDELTAVSKKLEATEMKVEMLARIVVDMGKQTEAFSQETLKFSQENKIIGGHVDKLKEHVGGLDRENGEIVDEIKKLDLQNDQTENVMKQFEKQNELLKESMKIRQEIYEAGKIEVRLLKERIDTFDKETVPKTIEIVEEAENTAHEMQASVEEMRWLLDRAKGWRENSGHWIAYLKTRHGNAYLKTPEGIDYLKTLAGKAFLKTPEGKAFLTTRSARAYLKTPEGVAYLASLK